MSRGLGKLQRTLLEALTDYGREAGLSQLCFYVAGRTESLADDMPWRERYSAAQYKATARAVAGLRRRNLVVTRIDKGWPGDKHFLMVRKC